MSIRNKVQLVGHLGQNPEIRTFGESGKLARFSVATNESYKNKQGDWVENTMWHNLVGWRHVADRIEQQLSKGAHVLVEGKLVNRDYLDKDNVKKYITEVEVNSFVVLDKKNSSHNSTSMESSRKENYKASVEDDDLPF